MRQRFIASRRPVDSPEPLNSAPYSRPFSFKAHNLAGFQAADPPPALVSTETVAIYRPFKYWASLYRGFCRNLNNGPFASSSFAIIPDDGTYYAICGSPHMLPAGPGANIVGASATTRDQTYNIWSAFAVDISIYYATPRDAISATITLSGTGGYVLAPSFTSSQPASIRIPVPAPYDEARTLRVQWAGGSTNVQITGHYYTVMRLIRSASVPPGWIQAVSYPYFARGNEFKLERPCVSISDAVQYRRATRQVNISGTNYRLRDENLSFSGNVPFFCAGATSLLQSSRGAAFYSDTSYNQTVATPSDPFLPFIGVSFFDGSRWARTCSEIPFVLYGEPVWIRNCYGITLVVNQGYPGPISVTVTRSADWSRNGPFSTTIYSGTWSHGGTGLESFTIPISYPLRRHADGAIPGFIVITPMPTLESIHVQEEPVPFPQNVTCEDGKAVAGGWHPDACVAAAGVTILPAAGNDFYFSSIPAADVANILEFTAPSSGLFRFARYNAASSLLSQFTTIFATEKTKLGIDEQGSTLIVQAAAGSKIYVHMPDDWGNIGKSNRTDRTVDRVTMIAHAVSSHACSLGANDLAANASAWGVDGSPLSNPICPLFQSFTPGATGTYQFAITLPASNNRAMVRWSVWDSLTDPTCATVVPGFIDDYNGINMGTVNGLLTAPPVGVLGTPALKKYIVDTGATGAWAGKDGQLATAWDPGIAGFTGFEWSFTDLPNGTQATVSEPLIKRGGLFVVRRNDVMKWTKSLVSGQPYYFRLGDYANYYDNATYSSNAILGNGIRQNYASASATNAITLTITAV